MPKNLTSRFAHLLTGKAASEDEDDKNKSSRAEGDDTTEDEDDKNNSSRAEGDDEKKDDDADGKKPKKAGSRKSKAEDEDDEPDADEGDDDTDAEDEKDDEKASARARERGRCAAIFASPAAAANPAAAAELAFGTTLPRSQALRVLKATAASGKPERGLSARMAGEPRRAVGAEDNPSGGKPSIAAQVVAADKVRRGIA